MQNRTVATTWIKPTQHGQPPKPRCSHASAVVDNKLYINGGWGGGDRFFGDIHIFQVGKSSILFATRVADSRSC